MPAALFVLGTLLAVARGQAGASPHGPPGEGLVAEVGGTGPVFTQNNGQFAEGVKFRSVFPWPSATLTDDGLVLTIVRRRPAEQGGGFAGHNALLRFEGAKIAPHGVEPAITRCSYFFGNDPKHWVTDVPCWQSVRFDDVAPGVAVDVHGRNGLVEYDLLIEGGAAVEGAHMLVEGAEGLTVLADGSLEIHTPLGNIRQLPPTAWQVEADGSRRPLETRVELLGGNRFRFSALGRQLDRPMVIDPGLWYGTFVETSGPDVGTGIAVDDTGSAYVLGEVFSNDFPTTRGAFQPAPFESGTQGDAVVAKLSPDGSSLIYATYLGGSGHDYARRIVVNREGEAVVVGQAHASDFPTTPGAYSQICAGDDGYVAKLNPTGTGLVFSTFFPGTGVGSQNFTDAGIDSAGRIVLAGGTDALELPTTGGAMQRAMPDSLGGFIVRMLPDGTAIDYCTYVGCTALNGIAVDADMGIYATGYVDSPAQGLPVTPGAFQTAIAGPNEPFALKLDAAGALQWCSYLGGTGDDRAFAIAVDGQGQPIVAGWTQSFGFPTTAGSFDPSPNGAQDGFITKFAADGSSLVWSTRMGGSSGDTLNDMVTDAAGNCFVVSATASSNMPVTPNAFDTALTRTIDAHIAKLSADGKKLLYGTYLGGSGNVEPCNGIAVDSSGDVYVTGYTSSSDIPTTPGAFDPDLTGFSGIYVAKFDLSTWQDVGGGVPNLAGVMPRLTANGSLLPLSDGSLHVDQALGNAACTLIIGLSELSLPFKGGTLVPNPLWLISLVLNAQGKLDLAWGSWPPAVPPGTSLWFQAWVKDVQSVAGFTATNGLTATVPTPSGP